MFSSRSTMTTLCALALVAVLGATGCTSSEEVPEKPSTTATKDQGSPDSKDATQDEILAQIDGFDFTQATDECALLEDMRSLNGLTGQLNPDSVAQDLSSRLEQTQVIFTRLSELSPDPSEAKTWQQIVSASAHANDVLGAYGGAIGNDEVLTALGELSLVYKDAADQHGQALQERCNISPDEIFVGK